MVSNYKRLEGEKSKGGLLALNTLPVPEVFGGRYIIFLLK